MGNVKKNAAKRKVKLSIVKKTRKHKIDEMLSTLLWNTNDEDVIAGLSKWEVDMSDLPTPSPDFGFLDTFDDVIMECDRVRYEMEDAIKELFVKSAVARGISAKTAREFIQKSWRH